MPIEVNKCIFRGSNSAILNFAALVSGVQLLLEVQILTLTPLWEGFVNRGRKGEVNKKLFPFVKILPSKNFVTVSLTVTKFLDGRIFQKEVSSLTILTLSNT